MSVPKIPARAFVVRLLFLLAGTVAVVLPDALLEVPNKEFVWVFDDLLHLPASIPFA